MVAWLGVRFNVLTLVHFKTPQQCVQALLHLPRDSPPQASQSSPLCSSELGLSCHRDTTLPYTPYFKFSSPTALRTSTSALCLALPAAVRSPRFPSSLPPSYISSLLPSRCRSPQLTTAIHTYRFLSAAFCSLWTLYARGCVGSCEDLQNIIQDPRVRGQCKLQKLKKDPSRVSYTCRYKASGYSWGLYAS